MLFAPATADPWRQTHGARSARGTGVEVNLKGFSVDHDLCTASPGPPDCRHLALHRLPCPYATRPPTRALILMDSRLPCPTACHLRDGHGPCVCLPVLVSGAAAGGAVVAVAGDSAAAAKKAPTKSRLLRTMRFCETRCRKHARSPSLSRSSPSRCSRSRSRCSRAAADTSASSPPVAAAPDRAP